MFSKKKSQRTSNRRSKISSLKGRSLRYETMEGRLVLSASGFGGNECAPELNDTALDAIVPTQTFSPQTEIAFQFSAADVVSDAGVGATNPSDILFILDPDLGTRLDGATPSGATLNLNDQGTTDVADDRWEFSWTPTADQDGPFRLFLIATDAGGTNNVPLSDVYSFNITIDNQPSVDLNGSDEDGRNAEPVSFTEADNSTPVSIVDSDLFIFSANGNVESVTVQIADLQTDGLESLGVTAGNSLVVDDSTPGTLVITVAGGGTADKSVFEDALRTLTYNNTSQDPAATRTINVTINDGTSTSEVSTATVNIQATNDRPDLQVVANFPNAKVGEEYVIDLVATDPDRSTDLLVFRITDGPAGAVISPNGLQDNSSDNTIQVSPDADGLYKAQIRWTPTTAQGDATSALFTVVVTDTGRLADAKLYEVGLDNEAPVANDDALAVGEDAGETTLGDILGNDTDVDGTNRNVNSVSAGGSTFDVGVAFTHPTSGATILVAADGQVQYNPNSQFESLNAGASTTDTFQYTINDGKGGVSGEATVTVTINGANDAPTAVAGVVPEFRFSEDAGATSLDLSTLLLAGVTDVDTNDILSLASAPANPTAGGIFSLNGANLSFDPNGDFDVASGAEETIDFLLEVKDLSSATVLVPAKLIIEGTKDAPVAVDDPNFTVDEDTFLNLSLLDGSVLDNDTGGGDAGLAVVEVNGDSNNVVNSVILADGNGRTGVLSVSPNGTFSFDPRGNFNSLAAGSSSQVTFTYRASDGGTENNLSNEATATITITGVNDTPVASSVAATAVENGAAVTGNFNGSDVDEGETATLSYSLISQPTAGAVVNNDDGTFAFDPEDDFQDLAQGVTREVTFNYTATDAQTAISDEAIATITVTGVNDAPVFDLNNTDGLASVLPTGDLQTAKVIAVELDLSSADANVSSLNLIDLPSFISDRDGDSIGYSLANGDNGGTPFQASNRPTLNASNQLAWVPTAADVGSGYVIRVVAQDQPTQGALSDSFDVVVAVVAANSPQVASVSEIDTSLDASVLTLLFDEVMGATAFVAGNYTFEALDGNLATTPLPVLSATALANNTGVELTVGDTLLDSIVAAIGTKLKLTLNSQIADADGNLVEGLLEHEVTLNTNAAS